MNVMDGVEETEKTVWQEFGPWLRRQREIAGKTRKQVAAAIDIHLVQLARIETGESGTRKETLDALIAELGLNAKEAYIKAGFWPPDEIKAEATSDTRAAEAARAAELIENFLTLPLEKQTQLLAIIRVLGTDHPELLAPPIRIVKAEDLTENEAEKDTG